MTTALQHGLQAPMVLWVVLFLALIGAWVLLRFLLRLTFKVFFTGCSVLVVLAVLVAILRLVLMHAP